VKTNRSSVHRFQVGSGAPAVQQPQPSAQVSGGLVRRLPVERHQGGTGPWEAGDLRAPLAKADAGYLDEVFATVDDLFETMHGVSFSFAQLMLGTRGILAARRNGSSESRTETASRQCNRGDFLPFAAKINLPPEFLNRRSTIVQQDFNSTVLDATSERLYALQTLDGRAD